MDFTSDMFADGRRFRTLNVLDDFSRECLALEVASSIPGVRVVRVLDAKAEVMQQLRHVYDGHLKSNYGTGDEITWKGHLGMIACSTPIIDTQHKSIQQLGDRFLCFRLKTPPRLDVAMKAQANVGSRSEIQAAIREAFNRVMSTRFIPATEIQCDSDVNRRIGALAVVMTAARSPVDRDESGIVGSPGLEGPGRVAGQLSILVRSLAAIRLRDAVGPQDFATTRRVAFDSVLPRRIGCLLALHGGVDTVKSVAKVSGLSEKVVRMGLGDLEYLGLVRREAGNPERWSLSEEYAKYFELIMD